MQDIQAQAINNYQENLLYFQEKFPNLHTKLLALETLLNEEKYPQKYDLEYKDGYFDVKELSSNSYLYNIDSIKYSNEMCESVTFLKNDHTIESFHNVKFELLSNTISDLKNINPYRPYVSVAPIMSYHNKYIDSKSNLLHIYKYIFFGVGLGLHLKCIAEKTNADVFLIIEDDIELFRLSLFTCNYKQIFQNKFVYFSIAQNNSEFSQTFESFYMRAIIENHFLKFSVFSSKDEKYIKKIQSEILIRPEKVYAHNILLLKSSRVMKKVTQNYKFLSMLEKNSAFFKNKPILVLAAGPSLGHNKDWLKKNHKKFIIIAPFMTMKLLYELNIAPDIIVHIDEGDNVVNTEMKFHKEHLDFFNNSLFVLSASASDIFFTSFKSDNIYLLEDRTSYKLNNNRVNIASVGETVYAIALSLSQNDIYLLGLDLSITDDGKTHIEEHLTSESSTSSIDTSTANIVEENSSLRKTTILVKGNFRDTVPTIPLFEMSIRALNFQTQKYKNENTKVYNLSDGAYFEETIACNIKDVKVDNFESIKESKYKALKEVLDRYSSDTLTKEEIEAIYTRKTMIDKYYNLLDTFNHSPSTNSDVFLKNFAIFISECVNLNKDELHQIIFIYILEVSTYITDIFTTKELENKKKHIKKIKKIFYTIVYNIINVYEKNLDVLIEKIENK
jgi:hypothetical protein